MFDYFQKIKCSIEQFKLSTGINLINTLDKNIYNVHCLKDLDDEVEKLIKSIWERQIKNTEHKQFYITCDELKIINYRFALDQIGVGGDTTEIKFGDSISTYAGVITLMKLEK